MASSLRILVAACLLQILSDSVPGADGELPPGAEREFRQAFHGIQTFASPADPATVEKAPRPVVQFLFAQAPPADLPDPPPEEKPAAEKADAAAEQEPKSEPKPQPEKKRPPEKKEEQPVQPPSPAEQLRNQLEGVRGQIKVAQQRRDELQERKDELIKEQEDFRTSGMAEPPPYSLLVLDQLRNDLATEEASLVNQAAVVEAASAALETARKQFEEKERVRRQIKESVDAATTEKAAAELKAQLALAELESELASGVLALRQLELDNEQTHLANEQLVIELLRDKVVFVSQDVQFTDEDLQTKLAELTSQEFETRQTIEATELNRRYAEERWSEARRSLDASATADRALAEEVEAWRLARRRRQEELAVLNRRLQQLAEMRNVWSRRFQLAEEEVPYEERQKWKSETETIVAQYEREVMSHAAQIEQLRNDITGAGKKLSDAENGPPEVARWLEQQRTHLVELIRAHSVAMAGAQNSQRLHERLLAELQQGGIQFTPGLWLQAVWSALLKFWKYELGVYDDRAITVGKIVSGILLLLLGILFARAIAHFLERRLRRRWKMNRDAAAAIKTLLFYSLLVIVTLVAMRVVNVPLTVFTVIGGALAIGVGLGSQGLVNNFLSGLIILAERPLRIGERIVYGGYDGFVEEVGFRATKVRTLTGHLVTIPNSTIISEAVENIGRRPFIRRHMNVTITYDTPKAKIEQAIQILREVLAEPGICDRINPVIQGEEYPPRVYFNEYNADSLNLLVIYWFAPPDFWDYFEHSQRVNLRIFEEFERAGIDFAFPTQTVYLAGDEKRRLGVNMSGGDLERPPSRLTVE